MPSSGINIIRDYFPGYTQTTNDIVSCNLVCNIFKNRNKRIWFTACIEDIGFYKTAWTWLHKLRRAMVRPGRDRLSERVEVDETYFGAPGKGGKRGRGVENKVLAAIAVETDNDGVGRIRTGILTDSSQDSLS